MNGDDIKRGSMTRVNVTAAAWKDGGRSASAARLHRWRRRRSWDLVGGLLLVRGPRTAGRRARSSLAKSVEVIAAVLLADGHTGGLSSPSDALTRGGPSHA